MKNARGVAGWCCVVLAVLAAPYAAVAEESSFVVGWGQDEYSGVNIGMLDIPAPNTGFVQVAADAAHCLGLKADGSIVTWGWGSSSVPEPNTGFVAVSTGWAHSLGLKANGSVVAWGWNGYGQCNVPVPNADFVGVVAGNAYSLGLKSNGSIVFWGIGPFDRLPWSNTGFVAMAGGHICIGLKADGSVVPWMNENQAIFKVPAPNSGFVAVAAGSSHYLGLKADGSVVAWGGNDQGQCDVPQPNSGFVAVTAGGTHSLGLKADGSIVAWGGMNQFGECNVPEPNSGFVAIEAGEYTSFGFKRDTRSPIPIALGERVAGTASPNRFTDYRLELEAGEARHLLVRVRPSGADGSWIVRGNYGALPLRRDDRFGEPSSEPGAIEMLIPSPAAGVYFFSICPRFGADGTPVPFEIEVLAVEHYLSHTTLARGGNTGATTFQVRGLGFESGVRLELRDHGNTLRTAEPTEILMDTLTVRLDLLGVAPGVYDVAVVWPSGAEETLPAAFEVVPGIGPRLEARIILPTQVRRGRAYTAWVEYANTGDSDMPAPLLYLSNTAGAEMKAPGTGRVSHTALALLGIAAETPAGILAPGSKNRIPMTFVVPSWGECRFELHAVQASNDPVAWAALEPLVRPCCVADAEWDAYWEQVTSGMGSTWAELLGGMSVVLNREVIDMKDASALRLFDFGNVLANASGELVAQSSPPGDIPETWNPDTDVMVTPVGTFDPARARTYVVTHGWNSSKDDPAVSALWQALADGCGDSNVFVVDWRKGAAGTAWEAGRRAASAGHAAAVKLHSYVVEHGGFPSFWNSVTYIGHADGNAVNKAMSEDKGRVGKALILDPSNQWGGERPNFADAYSKSLSIGSISLMDANPCSPLVRGDLASVQYLLAGVYATADDPVLHGAALRALGERLQQSGGCNDPWLNLDLPATRNGAAGFDGVTHPGGSITTGFIPCAANSEIGWLGDSLAEFVSLVIQPKDPNEKTGPLGTGSPETERFVQPGDELPYVVYFENKCTATAPAQEVYVVDYLDEDLDWSTFRLTEIAWGVDHRVTIPPDATTFHSRETVPDHRPGVDKTWWVDVSVDINYSTGRVQWLFRTLDPDTGELPEDAHAGFLPPNLIDGQCAPEDLQGPGEAHVAYTVKAKPSLAPGTRITNSATIVFDTEAPIVTNEVFNTIPAPPVTVPNVMGMTQADAQAALVAAGLVVGTVTEEYDATVAAGLVMGQEPSSGTLPPGGAVNLVLSKGPRPVGVPNVLGMPQAEAQAALETANLTVGTLTEQYSAAVPEGLVMGQYPSADSQVPPGSAVDLVVSRIPEPVAVPNVAGMTRLQAQAALLAAGLIPGTVTEQYSVTVAAGLVLSQEPASGTLPPGGAVNLAIAKRPLPVDVPEVAWMTLADAQAAIVAAGLTVGTVTEQYGETVAAGVVLGQEPASGDLPPGSAVSLVVATRTLADLDRSGKVDAPDVQLVINAALGHDIGSINADLNDDARVNASDIQMVINAALGRI